MSGESGKENRMPRQNDVFCEIDHGGRLVLYLHMSTELDDSGMLADFATEFCTTDDEDTCIQIPFRFDAAFDFIYDGNSQVDGSIPESIKPLFDVMKREAILLIKKIDSIKYSKDPE